jgi:valyl-tRNA synthetase
MSLSRNGARSDGKPMSKSRGNGIDRSIVFDKFGVDATRIYLAAIATGADIRWKRSPDRNIRNFANKIWNATRFCLINSDGAEVDYFYLDPKAKSAKSSVDRR